MAISGGELKTDITTLSSLEIHVPVRECTNRARFLSDCNKPKLSDLKGALPRSDNESEPGLGGDCAILTRGPSPDEILNFLTCERDPFCCSRIANVDGSSVVWWYKARHWAEDSGSMRSTWWDQLGPSILIRRLLSVWTISGDTWGSETEVVKTDFAAKGRLVDELSLAIREKVDPL